jgi:hypothetical protein
MVLITRQVALDNLQQVPDSVLAPSNEATVAGYGREHRKPLYMRQYAIRMIGEE